MCGIYGKVRLDGGPADPRDAELACEALRHRGPDDRGVYVDGPACLGHARLSIIDLSPLGHQPMGNEDGTLWIVFNGEIYNFSDLRPGLEAKGHRFRSRTDTEVVLHLYEEEGHGCVDRLRGMFAFAIWDGKDRTLFLARDRVGKKPLFYHHGKGSFSFCSALAPLVADPEFPRAVDRAAIHHYLTFQSVPAPMTAFAGVRKLPPGHWLRLREGREEVRRYWKLSFAPKFPADTPARRAGLEDRLFEEIRCAVRVRLLSDVPLGALLSGGVDSSGIVALMARERPGEPVKTFTVGFREKEYDELRFAREVSRICGTEHREFTISPGAASVLPLLVERFGEPFADSSAIPMYHITRIAREHVTVALCGDGGDESFAGYFRYKLNRLLGVARVVPPFLPRAAAALLRRLPHAPSIHSPLWISKRLFQTLALPPGVRNIRFYGHFDPEAKRALYTPEFASEVSDLDSDEIALARFRETDADNLLDATLYADIHTYLPDTLLPKVDVTSMANSMEIRSPLLDPFLMEFAARLPADFKLRRLTAKYALKRAFGRVLPERLFRRPKRGFGVPLDHWFRTELKGMVRELLLSPRTLQRGYFREEAVRRMLEEQEKNLWQWHHHLYNLMMLELWHRRFIDAAPGSERTGS